METLIEWLKTSIPGIIILGAFGSVVAAALIHLLTKKIPRAFGTGKSRFLSHKEVFDRIFTKRQHNLLLTYFVHHLMYAVTGILFGAIMAFWAFWLIDNARPSFSSKGILLLSGAFYFLAVGIFKAYFIKRAYREKFLPLLTESNSIESTKENL